MKRKLILLRLATLNIESFYCNILLFIVQIYFLLVQYMLMILNIHTTKIVFFCTDHVRSKTYIEAFQKRSDQFLYQKSTSRVTTCFWNGSIKQMQILLRGQWSYSSEMNFSLVSND